MNEQEHMIVDLQRKGEKGMFITQSVRAIKRNEQGNWLVHFNKSPKGFSYNPARLLFLSHPEKINIEDKGLYINRRCIKDAVEVLCFSDGKHQFYWVKRKNGFSQAYEGHHVYVTRTPINENAGGIWDYLIALAEETGLHIEHQVQEELLTLEESRPSETDSTIETEFSGNPEQQSTTCNGEKVEALERKNILAEQYERVDVKRDNVPMAQYLGDKRKLATRKWTRQVICPFGCNASQKRAVEVALTHQVSVVQGPPGTGKTQTILNIIANLLLAEKTVLVVSNNNSAVANVVEKLEREGLNFVVATLGSSKNKKAFIAQQASEYPDTRQWVLDDVTTVGATVQQALDIVSQGFDDQTQRALLLAEKAALTTEQKHFDRLIKSDTAAYAWLKHKPSSQLMELMLWCKITAERDKKPQLWHRLRWVLKMGWPLFAWLKGELSQFIASVERAYYDARLREIVQTLSQIEERLQSIDLKAHLHTLQMASLQMLKHKISQRYGQGARPQFELNEIISKSEELLREYPVVLSTTYSAKRCINSNLVFDYVIMDEASQVDITTGALALSCALNAVIVGDTAQLPQVVDGNTRLAIEALVDTYKVDERYNAATHSFLQSCLEVFTDAPSTLLREHYRCHPKIIEFCNQRFYDGQLIPMTTDRGEPDVLRVVRTVKGNHVRCWDSHEGGKLKRHRHNKREIAVIHEEVLPLYADCESLGIISPYRDQANEINQDLNQDLASTVHKFQGRECDTILMSMVDAVPTSFSDDPHLLNVAVSRAKSQLCIVTSGEDIPHESNLGQLISYAQYHNFEIKESKIHSVFDLLYTQYTAERLAYLEKHSSKLAQGVGQSEFLSEILVYHTLIDAFSLLKRPYLKVLSQYPLSKLIGDAAPLDAQERAFVAQPKAHVDLLVCNSLTHQALVAIEVDGWSYHQGLEVQTARDLRKDQIFSKCDFPLIRLSTTDIVTAEILAEMLSKQVKWGDDDDQNLNILPVP